MRKTLLLLLLSSSVMAESTLYIGDLVKIPMRSEAAITSDNIITRLSINTPVSVIKQHSNGWSEVSYQDQQGWIVSRYLTEQKPSNLSQAQLDAQKTNIKHLEAQNQHKQTKIDELEQFHQQQRQKIKTLQAEANQHNIKLLEHDKLQQKITQLNQSNQALETSLEQIKRQSNAMHSTDFLTLISTLMLFVGLAGGYWLSRASNKRNNIYTI